MGTHGSGTASSTVRRTAFWSDSTRSSRLSCMKRWCWPPPSPGGPVEDRAFPPFRPHGTAPADRGIPGLAARRGALRAPGRTAAKVRAHPPPVQRRPLPIRPVHRGGDPAQRAFDGRLALRAGPAGPGCVAASTCPRAGHQARRVPRPRGGSGHPPCQHPACPGAARTRSGSSASRASGWSAAASRPR